MIIHSVKVFFFFFFLGWVGGCNRINSRGINSCDREIERGKKRVNIKESVHGENGKTYHEN